MTAVERTLVLIKPDAVQRGLVGEALRRFENRELKIVGCKMMQLSKELLLEHYAHVKDQPFFPEMLRFMQSSPVWAVCLEGIGAVQTVRTVAGVKPTDLGSFRGDYTCGSERNLIHSSDSPEAAKTEIERFFAPEELFAYDKGVWRHVYVEESKY